MCFYYFFYFSFLIIIVATIGICAGIVQDTINTVASIVTFKYRFRKRPIILKLK